LPEIGSSTMASETAAARMRIWPGQVKYAPSGVAQNPQMM